MSTDEILERWWQALSAELGIDPPADPDALLDLAGTAAHSITRPAAPLSTFLVGYAAGRADADRAEITRLIEQAEGAAEEFE